MSLPQTALSGAVGRGSIRRAEYSRRDIEASRGQVLGPAFREIAMEGPIISIARLVLLRGQDRHRPDVYVHEGGAG